MKSWLTKLKLSAALDSDQPLSPALRQTMAADAALRQFAERTQALERALTATKPQVEAPPFLHRCIMRSVAVASEPAAAPQLFRLVRWLATPALAVLLAVGIWLAVKPVAPAANPAPLTAVSTTLELGNSMPQLLPPVLVAPLSDELDRLNRDLDNTAQFLLASVP